MATSLEPTSPTDGRAHQRVDVLGGSGELAPLRGAAAPGCYGQTSEEIPAGGQRLRGGIPLHLGPLPPTVLHRQVHKYALVWTAPPRLRCRTQQEPTRRYAISPPSLKRHRIDLAGARRPRKPNPIA